MGVFPLNGVYIGYYVFVGLMVIFWLGLKLPTYVSKNFFVLFSKVCVQSDE